MASRQEILAMLKRNADYNDNFGSTMGSGYIGGSYIGGCEGCGSGCMHCGGSYIGGRYMGGKKKGGVMGGKAPNAYNLFVKQFMLDPVNKETYLDAKDRMRAAAASYRAINGGLPKKAAKPKVPKKKGPTKKQIVRGILDERDLVPLCNVRSKKLQKEKKVDLMVLAETYAQLAKQCHSLGQMEQADEVARMIEEMKQGAGRRRKN